MSCSDVTAIASVETEEGAPQPSLDELEELVPSRLGTKTASCVLEYFRAIFFHGGEVNKLSRLSGLSSC